MAEGLSKVSDQMFNLLHIAASLLFFIFAIPLTIFALITTVLAFSTLALRVSVVYIELGAALVHSWLFVDSSYSSEATPYGPSQKEQESPIASSPYERRNCRKISVVQRGDETTYAASSPVPDSSIDPSRASTLHLRSKSDVNTTTKFPSSASLSLYSASDPTRDFEGVGGWRILGDGDEEALWMGMNSRLELPAARPPSIRGSSERRHHRRTSTGGSGNGGGSVARGLGIGSEAIRISPIQSRQRTPPVKEPKGPDGGSPEGYFNMKDVITEGGHVIKHRRSGSGSSHSSAGGTPGRALKRSWVE